MIAEGVLGAFTVEELEAEAESRIQALAARSATQATPCPVCEAARRRHPSADVVWGAYTPEGLARHLQAVHGRPAR